MIIKTTNFPIFSDIFSNLDDFDRYLSHTYFAENFAQNRMKIQKFPTDIGENF